MQFHPYDPTFFASVTASVTASVWASVWARGPYAYGNPAELAVSESIGVLPVLTTAPAYLLKGYSGAQRINYRSGRAVPEAKLTAYAERLFENPQLAYVDVRSARDNSFKTRITRCP